MGGLWFCNILLEANKVQIYSTGSNEWNTWEAKINPSAKFCQRSIHTLPQSLIPEASPSPTLC
jgi:hypothetical protein